VTIARVKGIHQFEVHIFSNLFPCDFFHLTGNSLTNNINLQPIQTQKKGGWERMRESKKEKENDGDDEEEKRKRRWLS
jgi:hypothetical protein